MGFQTILVILLVLLVAETNSVPLLLFNSNLYPYARCLDGTPGGFYFQNASLAADSKKYIIYIDGGGECTTEAMCTAQLKTSLGSSNYFAKNFAQFGFYNDNSCAQNPGLCTWNHVHLPYCTQDLHSGMITEASQSTWGMYFSGKFNFDALIDMLELHYGLDQADQVILTGASAGGIGVWLHLDGLAARLPKARVVGAPVAGFYFEAFPYTGPNHTSSVLADFSPGAWPGIYQLWNSTVDTTCKEALSESPWRCLLSNNSFPFISTATFITQAQTDEVVLIAHDWLPQSQMTQLPELQYMQSWHFNMTDVALAPAILSTKHGVFNAACFIHTGFSFDAPIINGLGYLQAFARWFYQQGPPYAFVDNCGLMCNPTCPKS